MTTHLRPAEDSDAGAVRAFLAGLSPGAQYARFFTRLGSVSPRLVRELVTQTARRRNLVAVHGDEVIGHAMAGTGATGAVEIGFVVADHHRREGVGTLLVRALVDHAARSGADRVEFEVLCENRSVCQWLARLLPGARFERTGYTMTGFAPVTPAAVPGFLHTHKSAR